MTYATTPVTSPVSYVDIPIPPDVPSFVLVGVDIAAVNAYGDLNLQASLNGSTVLSGSADYRWQQDAATSQTNAFIQLLPELAVSSKTAAFSLIINPGSSTKKAGFMGEAKGPYNSAIFKRRSLAGDLETVGRIQFVRISINGTGSPQLTGRFILINEPGY